MEPTVHDGFLILSRGRFEVRRIGAARPGPTLVFLHEGLGSVSLWRDFPRKLARETGLGAFVYSRLGYGRSDRGRRTPRPLDYFEKEARGPLPELLHAADIRRYILVGHSDGGSIALYHAARPDSAEGLVGVITEAAHVFCEPITIRSIEKARDAYREGDLRERLARHHPTDVDRAFWGWCDLWLDPRFASWNMWRWLPRIRAPLLALQGAEDQYGSHAQLEVLRELAGARVHLIPKCGHSPHRESEEETLRLMAGFIRELI